MGDTSNVWNALGSRNPWTILMAFVSLLVVSFIISNGIAFCVQIRREQRIRDKTIALADKSRSSETTDKTTSLPPVPVTILTGFLGAGKTTLLNRILQAPKLPFKIMVLENEIGTISIDHALIKSGTSYKQLSEDGIYVLQNGCMCCTASSSKKSQSELERILDYLLRIVNEQGFDYLLVETTGLADPGPIIEAFLQLRASRFRLDAIVTMVDTLAAQRFYNSKIASYVFPIELQRQLLYADVIALNKMDLVEKSDVKRVEELIIQQYNPTAVFHECTHAELELDDIIGIQTFDSVRFRKKSRHENESTKILSAQHTHGIQTFHIQVHGDVELVKFTKWLNSVTSEYARSHILRIKGILAVANNPHRCVLQCVLETYTLAPSSVWEANEPRMTQLVVIGKSLDKDKLKSDFYECLEIPDQTKESFVQASELPNNRITKKVKNV